MDKTSLLYSSLNCFKDLNDTQIMNIIPWLNIMNLDNQNINNEILASCKAFLDDRELSKNKFITNNIHKVEIDEEVTKKTLIIQSQLDAETKKNKDLQNMINDLELMKTKLDGDLKFQKENNDKLIKSEIEKVQKDFQIEKLNIEKKNDNELSSIKSENDKLQIMLEQSKIKDSETNNLKEHITKELKPIRKDTSDMHNMYHSKSTTDRGNVGEMDVNTVIEEPLGYQQHGTQNKVSRKMDGSIYDRNNPSIKILCEAKKYGNETYLGQAQIEKFRRDLKENDNIAGIFIAWDKNIQYENIKNGNMILRDNKAELYLCGDECYAGSPFMKNYIKLFYSYTIKLYELDHEIRKKIDDNHFIKVFKNSFTKLSSIMNEKEKEKENHKKVIDLMDKNIINLRRSFKNMNSSDSDIMYLINDCLQKDFETIQDDNGNIQEADETINDDNETIKGDDGTIQKSDGISETIIDSNDDDSNDDSNNDSNNDSNDDSNDDDIEDMLKELETDDTSYDNNDNFTFDTDPDIDPDNTDIKTIIQENYEKSIKIDKKAQIRETTSAFIKLLVEKFPMNNNINNLRSGFKDDKEKVSDILRELGYEEGNIFGNNSKGNRVESRNSSWNIKIK